MNEYRGTPLSFQLPDPWQVGEGEDLTAFDPDGVGIVTISTARRLGEEPPTELEAEELMKRWETANPGARVLNRARKRLAAGWVAEREATETAADGIVTYWHVWHVVGDTRIAFVTYNCEASDAEAEREQRNLIVETLRWSNDARAGSSTRSN